MRCTALKLSKMCKLFCPMERRRKKTRIMLIMRRTTVKSIFERSFSLLRAVLVIKSCFWSRIPLKYNILVNVIKYFCFDFYCARRQNKFGEDLYQNYPATLQIYSRTNKLHHRILPEPPSFIANLFQNRQTSSQNCTGTTKIHCRFISEPPSFITELYQKREMALQIYIRTTKLYHRFVPEPPSFIADLYQNHKASLQNCTRTIRFHCRFVPEPPNFITELYQKH